jgi:two-component sensor histidine kinase
MRVGPLLKNIIYSSGFLAFIPAVIIIFFSPALGTKYMLQVEPVEKGLANDVYNDIDSDGISEVFHYGKGTPFFYLLIQNNDYGVYDQWNFKDSIDSDLSDFFFGNYDNDPFKEIYSFTYKKDSLFLNINEFFENGGFKADRIYLTRICEVNGKVTSTIYPAGFFDTNDDGYGELFFSIQTGFGLEPRRFYSYDIAHNILKSSQFTGMAIQKTRMFDIDGDGRPEFFGVTGGSGNYKTWSPFSDMSSWLMIYDDQLKFKFPPVEFHGFTNILDVLPYTNGNFRGLLMSHNTGSADTNVLKPRVMLYSTDGKKIRDREYRDYGLNRITNLVILKCANIDRIYLLGSDLIEVNDKLEVLKRIRSSFNSYFSNYLVDINFDGEDELVLYSRDEEKLIVYNSSLQKLAEARLKSAKDQIRFSAYSSKDHENKIFMNGQDYGYFLKLQSNNFYYAGYLAYPGIYFLCFLFILLIKRINTLQVVQRESLNRRLVTLQLQGIKSQLDPHFTFNTLNSIASLIYLEDRELAYDYMNKFTQLLRSLINDAERIYRSLGEEIEFVTTYLDLEKLRFGDRFNYEISIDEDVNQRVQVPKLVLHTFAENAIKHGIMSRTEGGLLKIKAVTENNYLKLSIMDNGIGRAKSEGQSTSTGKGLKLTGEFYDILNQINKKPIKHFIVDMHDDSGDSIGTKVEVWVPVEEEGAGRK